MIRLFASELCIRTRMSIVSFRILGGFVFLICLLSLPERSLGQQLPQRGIQKIYRAVVVTRDRAVLSAEIPGRIVSLPAGVGAPFKKGDLLVEFDCNFYHVNRDKISQEVEAAKKKYENSEKLSKLASNGKLTVELALIDWRKAETELQGAQLMAERCKIRAPFDGGVVRILPQVYENISVGQPLVEVAGRGRIEVEAVVPSSWALRQRENEYIRFQVEDLNLDVPIRVIGVAPVIDPVSQLVAVRAQFRTVDPNIVPGMTGYVRIEP